MKNCSGVKTYARTVVFLFSFSLIGFIILTLFKNDFVTELNWNKHFYSTIYGMFVGMLASSTLMAVYTLYIFFNDKRKKRFENRQNDERLKAISGKASYLTIMIVLCATVPTIIIASYFQNIAIALTVSIMTLTLAFLQIIITFILDKKD